MTCKGAWHTASSAGSSSIRGSVDESGRCRLAASFGSGGGVSPGLRSIMGTNLECEMSSSASLAAISASSLLQSPSVLTTPQVSSCSERYTNMPPSLSSLYRKHEQMSFLF